MAYREPYWKLLKICGEKLTAENKAPFTRKQLIECVQQIDPNAKESTLNPIIQGITVNLKGGAPGTEGKNVFYNVDRGLFILYDEYLKNNTGNTALSSNESVKQHFNEENIQYKEPANNEENINNLIDLLRIGEEYLKTSLLKRIYYYLGEDKTWQEKEKTVFFMLKKGLFKKYKCTTDYRLFYKLPNEGFGEHEPAIAIMDKKEKKFVIIDIIGVPPVIDRLKACAYDMLHLKKNMKISITGIMIYIISELGVSSWAAKSYCYSYDYFYVVPYYAVSYFNSYYYEISAFLDKVAGTVINTL